MDKVLASSESNMWDDDFYRIQWAGEVTTHMNERVKLQIYIQLSVFIAFNSWPPKYTSSIL